MGYVAFIFLMALNIHWTSSCRYKVCYYLNWVKYRPGPSTFMPEDILPDLCTHVMYAYAKIQNNIIVPTEDDDADTFWKTGMYSRVQALRRRDPKLKVFLTVGGYYFGGVEFSRMAHNTTGRKVFIDYAIQYLRKNDFDGLDLAWEFPTKSGGVPTDKQFYTLLLQEISKAFKEDYFKTRMRKLFLSAVLAPGKNTIDDAYEVDKIHRSLDFATIKAFNYHGGFDTVADHSSPLYSMYGDRGDFLTVNFTVNYYLQLGFPKDKLVLGLALYGRNSYLVNGIGFNDLNQFIRGDGPMGEYTRTSGVFAYYEYCDEIKDKLMIARRNGNPVGIWMSGDSDYDKNYFLSYEDRRSVEDKVELVQNKGLLGIMFWSLDLDDFKGIFCDAGKYPLTFAAIHQCDHPGQRRPPVEDKPFHKPDASDQQDLDIPEGGDTEPPPPPPNTNSTGINCERDGIFEYPFDCYKFIICMDGYAYINRCPMGKVWNRERFDCNLPREQCWTSDNRRPYPRK